MKILLADDDQKVCSALRLVLELEPNAVVMGQAADTAQLLEAVRQDCPDLLLLDWELPGFDAQAQEILRTLRASCLDLRVILLSGCARTVQEALEIGADAFIRKTDPPEDLLNLVSQFHRSMYGPSFFPSKNHLARLA